MDVSSSQNNDMSTLKVDALQKSIEVNQQQALKIIESAVEQSKQVTAQKTGIGKNLNITG